MLTPERFQLEEVFGPHASADFSLSVRGGNTSVLDLAGSGLAGTLIDRHWPRVVAGASYLSDDDGSLLDRRFAQLRYSYVVSPQTRTFHFLEAGKDEVLLRERRWLAGSGIRRKVAEGERASLAVGGGLLLESERLDETGIEAGDDVDRSALRGETFGVVAFDFPGGARILNVLHLRPKLDEGADLRILNDLALFVPLTQGVRTTLTLEWRRDARPPPPLSRDDVRFTAGIGLDVH